jgi:ribose transport system permease protein
MIGAAYLLHFSVFGRYVYAIGGSRDAAAYSGIPVRKVEMMTYVISATCAGLAGVCETYVGSMMHTNGIAYELSAIAAAVIGGCSLRGGEGSVFGILIGCGIIRVIRNGINLFKFNYVAKGVKQEFRLDTNWNDVIIGSVILLAVILDQLVHFAQAKRRTRKAGEIAAAKLREAPALG